MADTGARHSAASIDKCDPENQRKANLGMTANTVTNFGYKDYRSRGLGSTSKLVVRSIANQGTLTNYFRPKKAAVANYLMDFRLGGPGSQGSQGTKTVLEARRGLAATERRKITGEYSGDEGSRLQIKGLAARQRGPPGKEARGPPGKVWEGEVGPGGHEGGVRGRGEKEGRAEEERRLKGQIIRKAMERAQGVGGWKDRENRAEAEVRPRLCVGPTLRPVKPGVGNQLQKQGSNSSAKKGQFN